MTEGRSWRWLDEQVGITSCVFFRAMPRSWPRAPVREPYCCTRRSIGAPAFSKGVIRGAAIALTPTPIDPFGVQWRGDRNPPVGTT